MSNSFGLRGLVVLFVLAGFQIVGHAQYGPAGGPYQPDSVDSLVDRVHADLNRGYDQWHLSNGDRSRLNNAEKRLRSFARDWRHERFDKGDLDDSIAAIQHVLDNNHLAGRERDDLWDDVEQLRRMRQAYDRHEIGRS
ncbi:MAG TPA: hypothetical protein VMH81_38295 [Bryobacteraceae bacterium]|nr:hypothetical protein [Bryobacteraceae bacterium]